MLSSENVKKIIHSTATLYVVGKKRKENQFSVSDAANPVKGHFGSRSRCTHGPRITARAHF